MKKFVKSFVLISLVITLSACTTAGNDVLRKESEASVNAKVTEGVTTKSDIKTMFGSPVDTSYTDGGLEIWKYELSQVSIDATSFIPVVSMFAASSSGVEKELTVLFDENNVVKRFNMSESDVKIRTGLLNQ